MARSRSRGWSPEMLMRCRPRSWSSFGARLNDPPRSRGGGSPNGWRRGDGALHAAPSTPELSLGGSPPRPGEELMRIIAGEWRGRTIETPAGQATPPTPHPGRENLLPLRASRPRPLQGLAAHHLVARLGGGGV